MLPEGFPVSSVGALLVRQKSVQLGNPVVNRCIESIDRGEREGGGAEAEFEEFPAGITGARISCG